MPLGYQIRWVAEAEVACGEVVRTIGHWKEDKVGVEGCLELLVMQLIRRDVDSRPDTNAI